MPPNPPASGPVVSSSSSPDYDFITHPPAAKAGISLPGSQSTLGRVALVGGLLIVILIVYLLLKGLFSSSNFPYYLRVLQDQQEIVHIAANASQNQNLPMALANFNATAQASVYSAELELYHGLARSGDKVSTAQLNLGVSTSIDAELSAAQSAGNYNGTYQSVMESRLIAYENDMSTAYSHSKGTASLSVLSKDYAQAQLMLKSISAASLQ